MGHHNMDTILLIEDDKLIRQMLRDTLERKNYIILEAMNGKRSLEILEHHNVNLILLDLTLPDGNGANFIPHIREKTNAPVIIVSGEYCKDQKVKTLNAGADDYIEKPFDPDLLIARINANLRRYKDIKPQSSVTRDRITHIDDQIRIGQWLYDPSRYQIFTQDGTEGELTSSEFILLGTLIQNAGRALKREELCESIRRDSYIPTPRAIDVKITRLRKKIGDNTTPPKIIRTIRGVGYMLSEDAIG